MIQQIQCPSCGSKKCRLDWKKGSGKCESCGKLFHRMGDDWVSYVSGEKKIEKFGEVY